MSMNRRNVLLGLGTAAAGSGVVFGSGAFTQTSADRSVALSFADDDTAALALEAGDNEDSQSEVTVAQDGSDGASKLDISIGEEGMVTDGVNLFRDVIKITNNGDQNVFLNTQVNSSDQSRAARVRVLAPVASGSDGTDSVATADSGTIDSKISGGTLGSTTDAIDISQPEDFGGSNGPDFEDDPNSFRLALLSASKDFYHTGVVELGTSDEGGAPSNSVNLSIEVEAGPKTGAGSTDTTDESSDGDDDDDIFDFNGEHRFVARDVNTFDGSTIEDNKDNFIIDANGTTLEGF